MNCQGSATGWHNDGGLVSNGFQERHKNQAKKMVNFLCRDYGVEFARVYYDYTDDRAGSFEILMQKHVASFNKTVYSFAFDKKSNFIIMITP